MFRSAARAVLALGIAAAVAPAAHASDMIFTHTYRAEVNPKGAVEVEQWLTYRTKKSQGTYDLWQGRTEVEYGITDRWQVSLYANYYKVTAENNNSTASRNNFTAGPGDGDEVTGGGPATIGAFVKAPSELPIPAARYKRTDFDSVSVESIYQFLSPYKDGFGLAAYVELTGGSKTREAEFKLLAQKNFLEDDLIFAANLVLGFERNKYAGVVAEKETEVQLTTGASYRVANGLRLAAELRNERSWEPGYTLRSGKRSESTWYAGPTLHYAGHVGQQGYWITAGYSQQLPWAKAYSQAAQVEKVNGRIYREGEKHVARLLVGFDF